MWVLCDMVLFSIACEYLELWRCFYSAPWASGENTSGHWGRFAMADAHIWLVASVVLVDAVVCRSLYTFRTRKRNLFVICRCLVVLVCFVVEIIEPLERNNLLFQAVLTYVCIVSSEHTHHSLHVNGKLHGDMLRGYAWLS